MNTVAHVLGGRSTPTAFAALNGRFPGIVLGLGGLFIIFLASVLLAPVSLAFAQTDDGIEDVPDEESPSEGETTEGVEDVPEEDSPVPAPPPAPGGTAPGAGSGASGAAPASEGGPADAAGAEEEIEEIEPDAEVAPSDHLPPPDGDDDGGAEEISDDSATDGETPADWWGVAYPHIERFVHIHTARTTRKHAFLILVSHSNAGSFLTRSKDGIYYPDGHGFFGFDLGSVKVGLGLRFGILEDLDVGAFRLNGATDRFDTYEFDIKYQFLKAEDHFLDAAARLGMSWYSVERGADALWPFGQLLLSRTFFHRLTVGTGFLWHQDSSGPNKTANDTRWSLAVPLAMEVRITSYLAWNIEMAIPVAGYREHRKHWPGINSALKFITNGHTFSLVAATTQYIAADGIVVGTSRHIRDFVIGFAITREISLDF